MYQFGLDQCREVVVQVADLPFVRSVRNPQFLRIDRAAPTVCDHRTRHIESDNRLIGKRLLRAHKTVHGDTHESVTESVGGHGQDAAISRPCVIRNHAIQRAAGQVARMTSVQRLQENTVRDRSAPGRSDVGKKAMIG